MTKLEEFLSKVVREQAECAGGGLVGDDPVTTFGTGSLDPSDIEGVTAECFNQQVLGDAVEWDDAVKLVREYMDKHTNKGVLNLPGIRAAYAAAVARQTHLSEAQRVELLERMVADATAPTTPQFPRERYEEAEPVEAPASRPVKNSREKTQS